jgi:hypothetical protein
LGVRGKAYPQNTYWKLIPAFLAFNILCNCVTENWENNHQSAAHSLLVLVGCLLIAMWAGKFPIRYFDGLCGKREWAHKVWQNTYKNRILVKLNVSYSPPFEKLVGGAGLGKR